MKTKININWNIEIDIETFNELDKETALNLMLKSSNLMNCFGDAIRHLDFHENLNKRINSDFKVININPKCAKKQIIIES